MAIPFVKTAPRVQLVGGANVLYARNSSTSDFEIVFEDICSLGSQGCAADSLIQFKIINIINPSYFNPEDSVKISIYSDALELRETTF